MKDLAFKERVLQRLITNPKAFVGPAKLSPKNIKNRVRNNINSANDYFDKLSFKHISTGQCLIDPTNQ